MKILFAGGGTGGHIFPIIAIARELRKINPQTKLYFVGPVNETYYNLLQKEEITIKKIYSGKIRRYKEPKAIIENIIDATIKIPLGIIQSFIYMFFLCPDVVFSKGGYGSVPTTIAAKLLNIPIFLHESDITPGKANKFISKFALEIFTSFPNTEFFTKEKMILVGNPIRINENINLTNEEIKKELNIKTNKPIIFVMGGSQGSERINNLILQILPQLLKLFEVIHQCGANNYNNISIESEFLISNDLKESYHLTPFLNERNLNNAINISNIIISRAGAGSIFEIANAGKASILIPLPESAQNHQIKNAYAYADFGASLVITEENLTPNFFLHKILGIIKSPAIQKNMENKAKRFSKPKSAKIIASYIFEFLNQ